MRSAVISDLHLGTRTRVDLLARPAPRRRLAEFLEGFDQLVLLGDFLELRDRPAGQALASALPFLRDVGTAMPSGRVVLVPGNHDHRLVHAARTGAGPGPRDALRLDVAAGSGGLLGAIRDALGIELELAYPGFAPAEGVWATHGHYVDVHSAAATLECTATEVLGAILGRPAARAANVDDYEALLSPTYALYYAIAQRPRLHRLADAGKHLVRATERRLGARAPERAGPPGRGRPGAGDPETPETAAAKSGAGRRLAGHRLGTIPGELRRPGVLPIARVLERLGVEADHVLFGHTHRAGPVADDDPDVWRTPSGTTLTNTGSWTDEPAYHRNDAASPYWPGYAFEIVPGERPRAHRLLGDLVLPSK